MSDTDKVRSFKDLIVWPKADKLFYDLLEDIKSFPHSRVGYLITDQVLRCVSSISANIAEATGCHSAKDFEHFLVIARRSTEESENWYIKIKNLRYISESGFNFRYKQCEEIRVMLNALIGSSRRKRTLE